VNFILFNLVLGLFNLLPIPPLDGGRIVVGILPEALAMRWAKLERAGILLVLLCVFLLPQGLREFGIAFDPVGQALNNVLPWAVNLVLRAAGHG
jgi:Zn-dependent protease